MNKAVRWIGYGLSVLGGLLSLGSIVPIMKNMAVGLGAWLWYQTPMNFLAIGLGIVLLGVATIWLSTRLKE
jgi:hypothetical protein